MHAHEMISTHPHVQGSTNDALIRCIEECYDCSQTCTSCADACLGEEMVAQMTQCIRTCLDCADVCITTGTLGTRRTGSNEQLIARMLEVCEDACRLCAEECEMHADKMEHCR
ncbi:four-helix bundle copper-binding protein [Brevundimonas vesicularis]